MTESTERQPFPDPAEPAEPFTAEPFADIYPLPNELRIVPASVAIDKAIAVAAARFEDISELDVLTPEQGGEAFGAHQLCLMLLENSSIDYAFISAELGYRSEGELAGAIGLARKEIADRLKTRF